MPICGYHPLMGEGIRKFAEGLGLALQEKADKLDGGMAAQMSYEADELHIIRSVLEHHMAQQKNPDDQPIEVGFLAIVYLANFMMGNPTELERNASGLRDRLRGNSESMVSYLVAFESAFENCRSSTSVVGRLQHALKAASDSVEKGRSD